MSIWNPWHGCHKISPGCANCYVYRRDESIGIDASIVTKTGDYNLPLKKNRQGAYKLNAEDGVVFTCMTSDFFLEDADEWRQGCWDMIRERQDLQFHIITKRIDRFAQCIPSDWGGGWEHVTICSTCENQDRADFRLPILLELPIKHREIISEPMLEEIRIEKYLESGRIEHVCCGGVPFTFRQTGAVFVKDGKVYHIERKLQHAQAKKSGYSYIPGAGLADAISYKLPERGEVFAKLSRSDFRSRFHLSAQDRAYIAEKGMDTVYRHAQDFVASRLSAENPKNDGKQTPMKGHPVFIAQHATACCCRGCIEKWHHIPAGKILTADEQAYIVDVLMDWISRELH